MTQCKILVRAEGGLGDCLLANRFIPAIREKHRNSHITFGFDNHRAEDYQLSVLREFYPTMSDKYCKFNQCDRQEYDYFYDLHIDKMQWTTYDFDWLSRFYYFPKPEIDIKKHDHIVLHLTHNLWPPKNLDKNYITSLVNSLYEVDKNLVAICTESEIERYSDVKDKVEIICSDIINACKIVASSRAMITIDSGFKYIAYSNGVPTIETADYYQQIGQTHPMIKARWLPFGERGLPLHSNPKYFAIALKNILENKIASIFPYVESNNVFKL